MFLTFCLFVYFSDGLQDEACYEITYSRQNEDGESEPYDTPTTVSSSSSFRFSMVRPMQTIYLFLFIESWTVRTRT
ncbi:hypothetical protein [Desulfovibrio gilichinskyi]|uniref:hypothetical protein n=1 Tax=Desulfovibrio gilichinskyi TaxID=1519643 RepID=UPI0010F5716A|nr:hypothetical protein [Desulfovibrio gilichinskyi]